MQKLTYFTDLQNGVSCSTIPMVSLPENTIAPHLHLKCQDTLTAWYNVVVARNGVVLAKLD